MSLISIGYNRGARLDPDQATEAANTAAAATLTAQTDSDLAVTAVTLVDTDIDLAVTAVGTVDTDIDTTVTDLATAFTNLNSFGDALVAITGDTYSDVTHQWTTGGATGLTHAQVVTLMALFNTASTAFITSQTAAVATQTASDLAVTAVALAQTKSDLAMTAVATLDTAVDAAVTAAATPNDVTLTIDLSKGCTRQDVMLMMKAIDRYLADGRTSVMPL